MDKHKLRQAMQIIVNECGLYTNVVYAPTAKGVDDRFAVIEALLFARSDEQLAAACRSLVPLAGADLLRLADDSKLMNVGRQAVEKMDVAALAPDEIVQIALRAIAKSVSPQKT